MSENKKLDWAVERYDNLIQKNTPLDQLKFENIIITDEARPMKCVACLESLILNDYVC